MRMGPPDSSSSDMDKEANSEAANAADVNPDPPPDGGYGWVCLFAYCCVNAFTWGVVAVSKSDPRHPTTKS